MNHTEYLADSPEKQILQNGPEYTSLLRTIDENMAPGRTVGYVPYAEPLDGLCNIRYLDDTELEGVLAKTDAVICISRDEDLNPSYTDQYPERNIVLTPSGQSNVDASVGAYHAARAVGNEDVRFISTGRMHNRAIRTMLALPVVAEFIGINPEDAYHIPEEKFRKLLDAAFVPEKVSELNLDVEEDDVGANRKAFLAMLAAADVPTPNEHSTHEELQAAAAAIYTEYQAYPRMSTSRLMVERAEDLSVNLADIYEEDGAVDTISNMLFTRGTLEVMEREGKAVRSVVIVAGRDHLPRTAWIANRILPRNIQITCIESDSALNPTDFAASCERERGSFLKGSKWIGEHGNPDDALDMERTEGMVVTGYFGKNRADTSKLAADIAATTKAS